MTATAPAWNSVDGPDTFTATYEFDDAAAAEIAAAAGGARAMAWQERGRRRQPAGPDHRRVRRAGRPRNGRLPQRPPAVRPCRHPPTSRPPKSTATQSELDPGPGCPRHAGHHRLPRDRRGQDCTGNERVESGVRISDQKAASTTIKGLAADEEYDVYVVSVSSVGETFPAVHAIPETDTTAPTVTASPNGGNLLHRAGADADRQRTGQRHLLHPRRAETLVSGGVAAEGATLYKGPIKVAEDQQVHIRCHRSLRATSPIRKPSIQHHQRPRTGRSGLHRRAQGRAGNGKLSWTAPYRRRGRTDHHWLHRSGLHGRRAHSAIPRRWPATSPHWSTTA